MTEKEAVLRDLNYYEPRLSPDGPAMGGAILSVLAARLGNPERAYSMFEKSYQPNELPPFKVIAETAGGSNPYFATGAGGMLQASSLELEGLISNMGVKQLPTQLPKAWKSLTLKGVGKMKQPLP